MELRYLACRRHRDSDMARSPQIGWTSEEEVRKKFPGEAETALRGACSNEGECICGGLWCAGKYATL
jgi:hypothetical protein